MRMQPRPMSGRRAARRECGLRAFMRRLRNGIHPSPSLPLSPLLSLPPSLPQSLSLLFSHPQSLSLLFSPALPPSLPPSPSLSLSPSISFYLSIYLSIYPSISLPPGDQSRHPHDRIRLPEPDQGRRYPSRPRPPCGMQSVESLPVHAVINLLHQPEIGRNRGGRASPLLPSLLFLIDCSAFFPSSGRVGGGKRTIVLVRPTALQSTAPMWRHRLETSVNLKGVGFGGQLSAGRMASWAPRPSSS